MDRRTPPPGHNNYIVHKFSSHLLHNELRKRGVTLWNTTLKHMYLEWCKIKLNRDHGLIQWVPSDENLADPLF
jgi:hypothetical protein